MNSDTETRAADADKEWFGHPKGLSLLLADLAGPGVPCGTRQCQRNHDGHRLSVLVCIEPAGGLDRPVL